MIAESEDFGREEIVNKNLLALFFYLFFAFNVGNKLNYYLKYNNIEINKFIILIKL